MPSGWANDNLPKVVWVAIFEAMNVRRGCPCKLGGTTVILIVPVSMKTRRRFLCPKARRYVDS